RKQAAATYILTHHFGDNWAFRSSGRYQYVSSKLGAIYQTGIPTDDTLTTFGRASYATNEKLNNWTFDNQLSGKVQTGPITHSLLVGVDRQVAHSTELAAFGDSSMGQPVTPIDAYHPVYGTVPAPRSPADIGTAFAFPVHLRQTGVYG